MEKEKELNEEKLDKEKYGPLTSSELRKTYQTHKRGKTNVEIHGTEKAAALKEHKSEVTMKSWKEKQLVQESIRKRVLDERGHKCERCGDTEKLHVHRTTYNYYDTDTSHYLVLCSKHYRKLHAELMRTEKRFVGTNKIKRAVHDILEALGAPKDDPNFKNTPNRVSRMFAEICWGYFTDMKEEIEDVLSSVFPSDHDQMIVTQGEAATLCPHHLLPVEYEFNVGVIPNGLVLGVSKTKRLFDILCSVPLLQEDLTDKVANKIQEILRPKGVAVLIRGRHACMRVRGVKNKGVVTTSAIRGVFKTPEHRGLNPVEEFLIHCGKD